MLSRWSQPGRVNIRVGRAGRESTPGRAVPGPVAEPVRCKVECCLITVGLLSRCSMARGSQADLEEPKKCPTENRRPKSESIFSVPPKRQSTEIVHESPWDTSWYMGHEKALSHRTQPQDPNWSCGSKGDMEMVLSPNRERFPGKQGLSSRATHAQAGQGS